VAGLSDLLNDQYGEVQEIAAITLGDIGPAAKTAVPALIEAMKRPWKLGQPLLRGQLAEALGKIGPAAKAAVPVLIEALNDWTPVRSSLFDSYSRQSP